MSTKNYLVLLVSIHYLHYTIKYPYILELSIRGPGQGRRYAEALVLEFSLLFCSFQGYRLAIGCCGSERLGALDLRGFLLGF